MKYLACLIALTFAAPAFADDAAEARVRVALAMAAPLPCDCHSHDCPCTQDKCVCARGKPCAPLCDCGIAVFTNTAGWHWVVNSDSTQAGLYDANGKQVGAWRFADSEYRALDGKTWGAFGPAPIQPPAKPQPVQQPASAPQYYAPAFGGGGGCASGNCGSSSGGGRRR